MGKSTKGIGLNIVFGNLLISYEKEEYCKNEFYDFVDTVEKLLPEHYYIRNAYGYSSVDDFAEDYAYLVKEENGMIKATKNKDTLIKYFRAGIPTELANVFENAAKELYERNDAFIKLQKEYIGYLKELNKKDPDAARKYIIRALQEAGIIDEKKEFASPYVNLSQRDIEEIRNMPVTNISDLHEKSKKEIDKVVRIRKNNNN